ncbi:hypothetical protein [Kitasatospora sp. NPDC088779]|uniref:hypothetical protein n=1 Tax=unclassified Kitasatospora TaxID=2633591 RepID=UPI00344182B1
MSDTTTKLTEKIKALSALIDHPRTGEGERDTARRMLARALTKAQRDGVDVGERESRDHRVYGEKYHQVRTLGLVAIAKLMREDVKLARRLGRLPATTPGALALVDGLGALPPEVKVSIRSEYYSGGGSIHIRVKAIPCGWGFVQGTRHGREVMVPSPIFQAALDDLKAIHAAYNYDGSDLTTDHFDRNYLGIVDYERPTERA